MKHLIKIFLFLLVLTLFFQCKDKYNSPYVSPPTGYLVVEGYIAGGDTTQFTLSRTVPLPGTGGIPGETKARVQVEGDDNSIYPLTEKSPGGYIANTTTLNPAAKYRLRILTSSGESYLSDFVPYRSTPPIDSINWVRSSGEVTIYANTHDPANTTHYYQWNYDETWSYYSAEPSYWEYKSNTSPVSVVSRPDADQIYRCWQNPSSMSLLLASTTKLVRDLVYEYPLTHIPVNDQRIGVLYSILVRQYALTEDGFNYLSLMQKNSESLGSLFDVQPSVLVGNIHCLSTPTKPVLGFISAGIVRKQRIFISSQQVFPWSYYVQCAARDTFVANNPDSLTKFFGGMGYIPTTNAFDLNTERTVGWYGNQASCIDCTLLGGTNVKPSFWPN